jgi:hypothetical protein
MSLRRLRKIFGSKREVVTGGWRNPKNKEHQYFVMFIRYYWGEQIKEDEGGNIHLSARNAYKV